MHPCRTAFQLLVPVWEAGYAELEEVQPVGSVPGWSAGLRFRTRQTDEWVIFWTVDRDSIIAALRMHGLAVSPETERLQFFDPGR